MVFHPGLAGSEVPCRPDVRVRGFGEVWSWGSWLMRGRSFVVKTRQEPVSRHNLPLFPHFIFLSEDGQTVNRGGRKIFHCRKNLLTAEALGLGPSAIPTERRLPDAGPSPPVVSPSIGADHVKMPGFQASQPAMAGTKETHSLTFPPSWGSIWHIPVLQRPFQP